MAKVKNMINEPIPGVKDKALFTGSVNATKRTNGEIIKVYEGSNVCNDVLWAGKSTTDDGVTMGIVGAIYKGEIYAEDYAGRGQWGWATASDTQQYPCEDLGGSSNNSTGLPLNDCRRWITIIHTETLDEKVVLKSTHTSTSSDPACVKGNKYATIRSILTGDEGGLSGSHVYDKVKLIRGAYFIHDGLSGTGDYYHSTSADWNWQSHVAATHTFAAPITIDGDDTLSVEWTITIG